MIIEYLQTLRDNPQIDGLIDEGIQETEILQLEQLYNSGNPFPKVLKELLYLAGNFCNFLDFSIYDSQQEMQDEERSELTSLYSVTISRPHYFIDLSSHGRPVFMYLDEGDNPPLYQILNNPTQANYTENGKGSLKSLIEARIGLHLEGYNPF
ncbi:hypothetical protein [Kordia sp.]|uniref:hypothetical protein n=1 Tax=Kordia sp. TaxID=1965332 RepID=UPI003D6C5771